MTRIPPILVVLFFGALAAFSVMKVKFSASLYEMLPADLPEVQGMDQLSRFFNRDGQLAITVKASESWIADEALISLVEKLEQHPELFGEIHRELGLSELVTEGGGLIAWLWLNSGYVDDVIERLKLENSEAAVAESMASIQTGFFDESTVIDSYDPLGLSRVAETLRDDSSDDEGQGPDPMRSEDGTFQLIYVEGAGVDFSNYRDSAVWLDQVRPLVSAWREDWLATQEEGTELEVGLTGTPAFMAEVGAEMERDMTVSVFATIILISILFWIMHRRTKPLSWLISAMAAILAITLGIGGLVFGDLSVMSAGFAAILMGLAVDYGIVIYREAMDSGLDAKGLRRSVGPGILWAAATTAVVFLSLNLSSMRGLAEMGNLVAMGVMIGALVMLFFFAPIAVQFNSEPVQRRGVQLSGGGVRSRSAGVAAVLIPVVAIASMLVGEMPRLEPNFHPFRIKESPSMIAWQQLQSELRGRENSVPTVVTANSAEELVGRLAEVEHRMESSTEVGLLNFYRMPTSLVPDPAKQSEGWQKIQSILGERERVLSEIAGAGFSDDGAALTQSVFEAWEDYGEQLGERSFALPTGKLGRWSVDRLFAEKDGTYAALATVKPQNPQDREWVEAICDEHTAVASLGSLGTALNERMQRDLVKVFLPMMGLLTMMLIVVFRSWRDLLLSLFSLMFAASALIILTVWTPLSWNSFNICGLPLLFGTGLDFGIHMIFALRRSDGDVAKAREGIGKALVFCGSSSAIGFGSLATASAYGLASLGIVCATGILVNMLVAVWLLPRWYRWIHRIPADKAASAA